MNKDDMINILNQHGIDALHSVISDAISRVYDQGYDDGYGDGIFESCDLIEHCNCDNNSGTKLLS